MMAAPIIPWSFLDVSRTEPIAHSVHDGRCRSGEDTRGRILARACWLQEQYPKAILLPLGWSCDVNWRRYGSRHQRDGKGFYEFSFSWIQIENHAVQIEKGRDHENAWLVWLLARMMCLLLHQRDGMVEDFSDDDTQIDFVLETQQLVDNNQEVVQQDLNVFSR